MWLDVMNKCSVPGILETGHIFCVWDRVCALVFSVPYHLFVPNGEKLEDYFPPALRASI